jgi:hypothetical protein
LPSSLSESLDDLREGDIGIILPSELLSTADEEEASSR